MRGLPRLHVVTDDETLTSPAFQDRARAVLESGGPDVALHLRGPGTSGRRLFHLAEALLPVADDAGARLLVNDRVDVAAAAGAHGAHLGQRSLPPADARGLLGSDALLGLSVHGPEEMEDGPALSALDYLMVGTLFATPSHPGRPGAGTGRLARVAAAAPELPLLGIGGVTPERVPEIREAGAHGVAVLRGVWAGPDPAEAVRDFRRALGPSFPDPRGVRG